MARAYWNRVDAQELFARFETKDVGRFVVPAERRR